MTSASTTLNTNDFDRGLIDSLTFALDAAKASGADDASVLLGDHQGLSVSTRHGKSEDLEREEQRSLVLDVYLGKRKASIRLNDLSAHTHVFARSALPSLYHLSDCSAHACS